jgi:two-component system cell cycle sensor histidine kinase/response regulator CckA
MSYSTIRERGVPVPRKSSLVLPPQWERRLAPREVPQPQSAEPPKPADPQGRPTSPGQAIATRAGKESAHQLPASSEGPEQRAIESQKLEAVGQLASGIAHDFNNILGVITGFSRFVHDDLPEDSPLRSDLEEVMEAAARGAGLVQQLMVFSRNDAPDLQRVNIPNAINGMERMLRQAATESVEIIVSVDPRIPTVMFDQVRLQQVLMNLTINARDAMPAGGKLMIDGDECVLEDQEVKLLAAGRYARLIVSDTGTGMSEEVKSRLFDPFFTTKPKEKGTGLGLATVYGIVLQAGGEIVVSTSPGSGTSFMIYLPETSDEPVASDMEEAVGAPASGLTILVVEDDPKMAEVVKRFLSTGGHEVVRADDGLAGLDIFRRSERRIDLVVTDVTMPKMTGIEMARLLREADASLKVIFISGNPAADGLHDDLSGETLLKKPFSREQLLAEVTGALSARAA